MESNKLKIYIVDIEENTINRLEELFYNNPNLGIKVIGYSHNYNNCINDLGRARNADVFLVSAYLPDTMGTELIGPIKKINPNAKVLIMLQKNTRNLAEVSMAKGADGYIQKPFKARQLIDKVQELAGFDPSNQEDEFTEYQRVEDEKTNSLDAFGESANNEKSYIDEEDDLTQPNNEPVEEPRFKTPREFKIEYNSTPEPETGYELEYENEYETKYEEQPIAPSFQEDATTTQQSRRALFDVYSENPTAPSIYEEKEDVFEGEKPNIVCTFSSAGSNGKTTMLVNSAIAIQKYSEYKPKICIIDFNLLYPSVLYKFHQDDLILCKKTIFDLCEDINSLDENLINQALVTHEPTGIKILETPSDVVRDFSRINPDTIQQLISHLREMFDLILIDTSSNIREDSTSFPLTVADKGIVLLEPDLANLLHTRKLMSMIKMFENNLPEKIIPKLQFVLNKENPKAIIHVDTIKKTLYNTDIYMTIPEDNNITHLSNNGQFAIDSNSQSVRSIKELARSIYPFDHQLFLDKNAKFARSEKKKSNSLFSSLFKKK